jgi:hypothetical protein
MSKTMYARILTGWLLLSMVVACTPQLTQAPQSETETPILTARPTDTATPVPTVTEFVASLTPTPEFAPFCEPDVASNLPPSQCQVPIAEQSTVFCTNKIPYNLIFINEGSTYEVLSEGFNCSDAGMKDGKQMLTCTGPMASSFELRVCDPACAIPTIQTEITRCPQDYTYNNLLGCCTQEPQLADENCVLLELRTNVCVIDCGVYTKKSACEKNSFACQWDGDNNVCLLRR